MCMITGKTKHKQRRGSGTNADYKPWILCREISSSGTKALIIDWKTGRQVHCLSQNEKYFYYMTRWDDDVLDINEQFPLERNITEKIAESFNFVHPRLWNDPDECMTTDFLVTYMANGRVNKIAYSVKDKESEIYGSHCNKRLLEKQAIEKTYWESKGIDFEFVFGDKDINKIFARNIALVVKHFDSSKVNTISEFMCHLIANKHINVPLKEKVIDVGELTKQFLNSKKKLKYWLGRIYKSYDKLEMLSNK